MFRNAPISNQSACQESSLHGDFARSVGAEYHHVHTASLCARVYNRIARAQSQLWHSQLSAKTEQDRADWSPGADDGLAIGGRWLPVIRRTTGRIRQMRLVLCHSEKQGLLRTP
jgi:hypothetical protein